MNQYRNIPQQLNNIFENLPVIIIIWTFDDKIVWFNRYASLMNNFLGYGLNDKININSIIPQSIVCRVKKELWNGKGKNAQYKYDHPVLLKEGKEKYLSWNNFIIFDDEGQEYIASIGADSTNTAEQEFSHNCNIIKELQAALDNEEFFLCYQPFINIKTKKAVWMEALIRWKHPKKGIINPVHFIPIAEETGLIIPIGEWVLQKACTQLKKWHTMGYSDYGISINISGIQLQQNNFPEIVSKTLSDVGLLSKYIELEITENVFLNLTQTVKRNLNSLKNNNINISIDDFGTGYNSLINLQEVAITHLKIDRKFIKNIKIPVNQAIIETIIELGHKINAEITAEGVETKEQYDYLKKKKCDKIQGYYFSKPLLIDEMTKFIEKND